ncbi:MAG: carcinine hydrolase/isopenicillin-N N-acyltransferase family protein [Oscillospiraceae bacterium]|nr:carcinine hydrolase/isopenicillin-N N-acyltransferase family protein [Oscillospiraceae bacterium]
MGNPHAALTDPKLIETVESLRRVDEAGYLYYMDCGWDYYNIPKEFAPIFDAGCSTFFAKNMEGEPVMYRNYDYKHYLHGDKTTDPTSCGVVVKCCNPSARFRSIGVADAFWLDRGNQGIGRGVPDDGKTDISAFAMLPYICMDGLNEAGLTISIMALVVDSDWNEIDYEEASKLLETNDKFNFVYENTGEVPPRKAKKAEIGSVAVNHADKKAWKCSKALLEQKVEGKPTTMHTILMRMILDNCANVDEAVALTMKYNMKATMVGSDYHIMIGDANGRSVVIEWVGDETRVLETNRCTNYHLSYEDGYRGTDRRYECLEAGLDRFYNEVREDYGITLLALVKQDPTNGYDRSMTLTTSVYNTIKKTLRVFVMGDFSKSYDFTL